MASTDATFFPIKGQAFRIHGAIFSATTGNPISGGLTTLAGTVSQDGGSFTATGVTVTEIGTSGVFTVDLTSSAANYDCLVIKVTAANSGAVYWLREVPMLDLAEPTGRADSQTVKRLETFIVQTLMWHSNLANIVIGGAFKLFKKGGSTGDTPSLTIGAYQADDTSSTRPEAS